MPYRCIEDKREYQRTWIANRRMEWFEGRVCEDCGSSESLELDHIDRTTKVSHKVWSWSTKRREIELAKCCARCTGCHINKTHAELGNRIIIHGSRYRGYQNGCRCEECVKAQKEYNSNWRYGVTV